MGSKIESRIAMQAADVPVVPGITTNIETSLKKELKLQNKLVIP